jgi:NSS family neurotransmitter:Na+ symporter
MAAPRGEFSSKLGFLMAAAGSAVGLGNVISFPSQVASNGGAAFLLLYLLLAFLLAYPALMAELVIGRHAKANSVEAMRKIAAGPVSRRIGVATGFGGMTVASLILSFYVIMAGWMLAHALASATEAAGFTGATEWLIANGIPRNLVFAAILMGISIAIICGGVKEGIEKWCSRLMPALLIIMVLLIVYVLTLDGAIEGLKAYLVPDFSRATSPRLVISAMGQAFFSLSLGVGTMLIYGSYVSDQGNIVSLGRSVTLLDISIAMMAGMLVMPAMYAAQAIGVPIYDADGNLVQDFGLVFAVLPALFDTMGGAGSVVSFAFFVLITLAAITSSISVLEVPVAYAVENHDIQRRRATMITGAVVFAVSTIIILNFDALFSLVITVSIQYGEPTIAFMMCIFVGWIMHRNALLQEISKGHEGVEDGLFWKIWPFYVRYICPAAILIVLTQSML